MQLIRLTKTFTFDMAHALYGYDGPCKNIHGHTYKLRVTVLGAVNNNPVSPKLGMVMDFGELKTIVNHEISDVFDHALVLNADSPHRAIAGLDEQFEKVVYLPYQPTCENLLADFVNRLRKRLPDYVTLCSLRLDETPTSYAEWYASDNKIKPH